MRPDSPGMYDASSDFFNPPENYMGYVVGFRVMELLPFWHYLLGKRNVRWYSPRQKARCTRCFPDNLPPHDQSAEEINFLQPRCGINMYSLGAITFTPGSFLGRFSDEVHVFSSVYALTKGWGKVAIHEDGYRVQQALITHLLIDPRLFRYKPPDVDFLPGFFKRGTKMIYDIDEFKETVNQHPDSLTPIPGKEVT